MSFSLLLIINVYDAILNSKMINIVLHDEVDVVPASFYRSKARMVEIIIENSDVFLFIYPSTIMKIKVTRAYCACQR